MSDLVALAFTVLFAIWFVGFTSVLAVSHGATWVPKVARQIAGLGDHQVGLWQRRLSIVVASAFVVLGQVTAIGVIAQNLGRASLSAILILAAEPVIATAWAAYLIRSASSRGV
jgi:hypothetical protein